MYVKIVSDFKKEKKTGLGNRIPRDRNGKRNIIVCVCSKSFILILNSMLFIPPRMYTR